MRYRFLLFFFCIALSGSSGAATERATFVGGTLTAFQSGLNGTLGTREADALVFATKKTNVRIPYRNIKMIEYGQRVNRRVMLAYAVSPMFLLLKARKHFVTLQFHDDAGQQAMVLRVDKNAIRPLLATLEARSGLVVRYQDDDARRLR